MQLKRILLLGGTNMAREAANALVARGLSVVTSFAGVTHNPHLPQGGVCVGGFGGIEGLSRYLRLENFDLVIDGTHPFAAQMSAHAFAACIRNDVRLVRLQADAWQPQAGDDWHFASSIAEAVQNLPQNAKVAVTIGRKEIGPFFGRSDLSGIARMIEPPTVGVPPQWQVLLERPPFTLNAEIDLLRASEATFLVSKNAGGKRVAKLDAAAALGLPVVMINRPQKPDVATATNVSELLGILRIAD